MRYGVGKLKVHTFRWNFFYPPQKFFTPFFAMAKKLDFYKKILKKKSFDEWKKRGVKNFEGVKNFFIKKYGPSAFQRRVAHYSSRLSYSWALVWNLLSKVIIFEKLKNEFVSILVRIHFSKIALDLIFKMFKIQWNFWK